MRLLIATPLYPPDSGGPATYVKLLEKHLLAASGGEVIVVKFGDVRALPKVVRHVAYFWKVLRAARKVDLVLALDPVSTGLPALCAARIAGKPFVVKIVGDFAWEQGSQRFKITETLDEFVLRNRVPFAVALLRKVQTLVARNAVRIIVPSDYLKKIVTSNAWGKTSPDKVVVIYNAIELPEGINKTAEHGSEKLEVVSAGRFVPWKGMEGVIDAVAEVRKEIPGTTLALVGDGPEKNKLQEHGAAQLGSAISFTGQLTHVEALRAIQSGSIFVLNSTYEGLSHLLIEALMLGKPIVATNAGGNPELIEDGVNGVLVQVNDTMGLGNALTRLLKDEELRARLGEHAKNSSERFTLSIMIEKTRELLSLIIQEST